MNDERYDYYGMFYLFVYYLCYPFPFLFLSLISITMQTGIKNEGHYGMIYLVRLLLILTFSFSMKPSSLVMTQNLSMKNLTMVGSLQVGRNC